MDSAGRFVELQRKLRDIWPTLTPRSAGGVDRTVIVVHSINIEVPDHIRPLFPAYEERFLFLVLTLLRAPRSRVVYVTSQPVLPRLIDYYLGLAPGLNVPDARERLFMVSIGDGGPRTLTEKVLARPRLLARIRNLVLDPGLAFVVPFSTSRLEAELAARLGVPVYGPNPALLHLGTKSGSRRLFREEGVPHPSGVEGVASVADVVEAIGAVRATRPDVAEVVVKHDEGLSGLGNGIVDLRGAEGEREVEARVRTIRLEDPEATVEEFLAVLGRQAGIVEERIAGEEFRSPSVQLRVSPDGEVEVLSTHDQVLGGHHGQTYFGCRFPADPAYAAAISREAMKVGLRLGREGVIGRFGLDFVAVRDGGEWRAYAVEINLRNGGTTHPLLTLQALTDGTYDPDSAEFRAPDGTRKYYAATDHLESPAWASLTPDDVLDLIGERGLGWDERRQTGLAFHMVSAVAVAGRVGVTAIGDTPAAAAELYTRVGRVLDEETGVTAR